MTTNISTQQESPKAGRWTELRSWFISLFNRPNESEGLTKPETERQTEPSESEGFNKPSEGEAPNEPSPAATDKPSSAEPEAPDPMAEIRATLQRVEEALTALPRIEEALLRLPTPAAPATAEATPDAIATPTPEHQVGTMLLSYVAQKHWTGLWAHKLLEDPEGKAEQNLSGAILLARTVLQHGRKVQGEPAKTLEHWAKHGGPPPARRKSQGRGRRRGAVS